MATFYLFGKYTQPSITHVSAQRTKKAVETIEKLKGKVKTMDALLGEKDLVFVVEFPSSKEAIILGGSNFTFLDSRWDPQA